MSAGTTDLCLVRAVTVVLADAQPVVRWGLRAHLSAVDDIEVVAEAGTGPDAVREALRHRPDVLIMDLRMGADAISEVPSDVAVLVFTDADDPESVHAALRAGARGYLLKGAGQDDLVRMVRGVAAGEAIFCALVAGLLSDLVTSPGARPLPGLTTREREVLELITSGMTNAAIALRLGLARKTVVNTSSAIFRKLRVATRADAITMAREAGL
jgi:DNA-binding NarL/FixJ family response regulator